MVRRSFNSRLMFDRRIIGTFNLLYIVTRPTLNLDLDHRILSPRVVDTIDHLKMDSIEVQLHILRPETWPALVLYLNSVQRSRGKKYFELAQFDMHGHIGKTKAKNSELDHTSSPRPKVEGQTRSLLHSVDETQSTEHVARLLSQYKIQYKIPAVVLNAFECANANRHGIAPVFAMSYEFSVAAADLIIDTFYKFLLGRAP